MRSLLKIVFFVLLPIRTTVAAKADGLVSFFFTDGTETVSFSLPGALTPSAVSPNCRNTGSDAFCLYNQTILVNGVATLADLDFFNVNNSGGILFEFDNQKSAIINQDSVPLFTGTLAAPIFTPGTFAMTNETDNGLSNLYSTNFTGTISEALEASAMLLTGTGLLTVFGAVCRKLSRS